MQQVTLQAGDYVLTEGMTEEQYHAVARAFMMNAGVKSGEYPNTRYAFDAGLECFGVRLTGFSLFHGDRAGSEFSGGRQLTIGQVLNATSAGGKDTDMQDWKPEVGKKANTAYGRECEVIAIDDERKDAAVRFPDGALSVIFYRELNPPMTEEDEAVKDMKRIFADGVLISIDERLRNIYRAGYRKQPTEDMTDPANWRAGDILECVGGKVATLTVGKYYVIQGFDKDKDPIITYDDRDTGGELAEYFRFHSRS